MNRRKGIVSLIATLMIISMAMVFPLPVTAADPPTVTVTFPNGTSSSVDEYDVDDTFIVDIVADSNVQDVWSWQSGIRFDPSILECTGLGAGDFFAGKVVLVFTAGTIDNTAGHVSFSGSSLKSPDETQGVIGTGSLVWYEFTVIGYGTTSLGLTDTTDTVAGTGLVTTDPPNPPVLIPDTVLNDGSFDNTGLKPAPYAPTVDFTYSPTVVYENDIVTFTATTTPGFDGDVLIDVSEYRWDFDGDTVIDLTTIVPTATNTYTLAGTYYPTVEVYAGPNKAGAEYETASTSKTLIVYEIVFSLIDVYTQKAGTGPNVYGSAFARGDTVTLSAELLYAGIPVPGYPVSFEVRDAAGALLATRSSTTDVNGIATIDIRTLPLLAEAEFGTFTAIATATFVEEVFTDTVSFYVGFIVDVVSVTPPVSVARGDVATFSVVLRNYALESQTVLLAVTVYDTLGVPVGVASSSLPIAGASSVGLTVNPYDKTEVPGVTIPTWAWPGPATVYANALDTSLSPYCEELSATFSIT